MKTTFASLKAEAGGWYAQVQARIVEGTKKQSGNPIKQSFFIEGGFLISTPRNLCVLCGELIFTNN
jgi:hypothetical protein